MSNLNECICGTCKHYDSCLNASGGIDVIKKYDTCEDWEAEPTEEELEAQQTDVAERETHRREVEEND